MAMSNATIAIPQAISRRFLVMIPAPGRSEIEAIDGRATDIGDRSYPLVSTLAPCLLRPRRHPRPGHEREPVPGRPVGPKRADGGARAGIRLRGYIQLRRSRGAGA